MQRDRVRMAWILGSAGRSASPSPPLASCVVLAGYLISESLCFLLNRVGVTPPGRVIVKITDSVFTVH